MRLETSTPDRRGERQQLGHERRGVQEVLEVVDDQQQLAFTEIPHEPIRGRPVGAVALSSAVAISAATSAGPSRIRCCPVPAAALPLLYPGKTVPAKCMPDGAEREVAVRV